MNYTIYHHFKQLPVEGSQVEAASARLQILNARVIRQSEEHAELIYGSPLRFRLFGIYLSAGITNLPIEIELRSTGPNALEAKFQVHKSAASISSDRIEEQFQAKVDHFVRTVDATTT